MKHCIFDSISELRAYYKMLFSANMLKMFLKICPNYSNVLYVNKEFLSDIFLIFLFQISSTLHFEIQLHVIPSKNIETLEFS